MLRAEVEIEAVTGNDLTRELLYISSRARRDVESIAG